MRQRIPKKFAPAVFLLSTALALSACGKSTADVAISSAAVAPCTSCRLAPGALTVASLATGEKLEICIKRIKLEGDDDQAIKKSGETGENGEKDPDDIKFAPGLITLDSANSTASVDWGKANIPVGFKLKRMKIKVKRDTATCGTSFPYSVRYTDSGAAHTYSTAQDIEFRFRFNPSIDLDDKTSLNVSLNSLVGAIQTAAANTSLGTGDGLKAVIEGMEAGGSKK